MSREWLLVVRCDVCGDETTDDGENGTTLFFSEAVDKLPGQTVDLCGTHAEQLAWLSNAVRPIQLAEKKDRPPLALRGRPELDCPFCLETFTAGSGIALHVKGVHPKYYRPRTDWSKVTFDGKQMVG